MIASWVKNVSKTIMSSNHAHLLQDASTLLHDAFSIFLESICAIFLWPVILFVIILPTTPIWLPLICLRKAEQLIYEQFFGAERMNTDDVFWMLDTPKNKSIINGIMVMNEHFELSRLQNLIQNKMIEARNGITNESRYINATRYVRDGLFNYYWCTDKHFDVTKHVYEWSREVYRSSEEMAEVISRISTRPFVRENKSSPWEYIVLYYLDNGVEKTCLLLRCHHSLADGLSLVNFIVNSLSDEESSQLPLKLIPKVLQTVMKFKGLFFAPLTLLKVTLPAIPRHNLHCTKVTGVKDLRWSRPISLQLVKDIKDKLQVTINDVLVGCLATSLHNNMADPDDGIPDDIMTSIPFNTRYSLEEAETFANKFAIVFVPLPTRSSDPVHNIMEINKRVKSYKYSADHHGMRYAAKILNYALPLTLNKFIFAYLSTFSSMVLSNVPGPQLPVSFDGSQVEMMCFWPPQKKNIGLAASILSYHGEIRVAVSCDTALKTKPEKLMKSLPNIFNSVAQATGVVNLHNSE